MFFGKLDLENKVQIGDKTRVDASRSFTQNETISLVEIQPELGEDFYTCPKSYLDWAYNTSGEKAITVRVTTDLATTEFTGSITAVTEAEDVLFSSDSELIELEDDILDYVRNGRSSFLDKHRASQKFILDELDSDRIWKDDGTRYVAADIIDIQDFNRWSVYKTLEFIFTSLTNKEDDIFNIKSTKYRNKALDASKRSVFRLDSNSDDEISLTSDIVDNFTKELVLK